MASSGSCHLKDIDEKFCQCAICLQQYSEPKLLPCLHRYCSDCLKQLIGRNQGVTVISCPECRYEVTIPAEGVNGFKTDFYMKNIIEYIQIQRSLEAKQLLECCDCSKTVKMEAYCFKCNGLLCKDCHISHMTKRSLKDHKQHTLALENLKSKSMTMEKLTDLKEAPRCQNHLNDLCLLCCRTCNELPICVACVHGIHKNHDINDVKVIAAEEREKLQNEMKKLDQYKEQMLKMPQTVQKVKENATANFRERKETFTTRYEKDKQNVKREIEKIEEEYKGSQAEIENNKERELTETKKRLEKEMKQIKIKYDNNFNKIEKKSRVKLDNLRKEKEGKVENSREKLATLERKFERATDTFAKEQEERVAKLEKISQQIDGMIGRYKNLTATGNSVLETKNDWTAVQCITDIFTAIEPLIGDMKKRFSELDKLSKFGVGFKITEDEESPVNIEGVKTDFCQLRKMASSGSSHLKDIDEKFCQCSICLQQYREPKQLPCLHRYCSDCLKQLIERNQGVTVISCPECRDESTIPTEGVNGFKTDFYMKNIIEYIQLNKSLEDEKLRDCYGCLKKLNVTSYCFKCNGILCEECYKFHMTNQSLKEHKQYVLSLEDLNSKQMTLEKLADLKEAPRCQSHVNDLCQLCCRTCNELPICVACVHGIHKNHDINDVKVIAAEAREKLQKEMKNLDQYKEQMLKMPQTVERVKENITAYFRERKETFTTRYERETQNVKMEIEKIEEGYQRSQTEVENNKERELTETKRQLDEEMKQIKIKYDNKFVEIEKESRVKLDNLRKEKEGKVENSREKLATLEREFELTMNTSTKEQEERIAKLENNSQQIDGMIDRYKNLTATGNSVLGTRNDWTAVQCIPDICKAIEPLRGDMKKAFPELDKLSRIGIGFEIEEDEESPVNIEGFEQDESIIDGITCVDDGSIVITGHNSSANYHSHITVINMKGKVLHHKKLEVTLVRSDRYCAHLSLKIATVCWRDEIGVFDIRNYSYIKKNIRDVINSLPVDLTVMCVRTDLVNNHILVGVRNSRDVYVFDDQLNYNHTLALPEMIKFPRDMAFSEGKLLICDLINKSAYVVTVEGQRGKVTHEVTKPDCNGDDWRPLSVCTDSNGFIYILWMTGLNLTAGRRIIVQYTQDGSQPLTQKEVDSNDARCIATVKTNFKSEKLLVASWKSGKLRIYTII